MRRVYKCVDTYKHEVRASHDERVFGNKTRKTGGAASTMGKTRSELRCVLFGRARGEALVNLLFGRGSRRRLRRAHRKYLDLYAMRLGVLSPTMRGE